MKKMAVILSALFFFGCAYGGEQLETWVKDPHYTHYREQLDTLEKSYLSEQISYSEYIDKKQQLEAQYDKEVKERENKINQ